MTASEAQEIAAALGPKTVAPSADAPGADEGDGS
jgi:hypothetical protein